MENRRDPRLPVRFQAVYTSGREEGTGVLCDLSRLGARVAETLRRPPIGSNIRLFVMLAGSDQPVELVGRVARHTLDGFATEHLPTSDVCDLVEIIRALVAAPEAQQARSR